MKRILFALVLFAGFAAAAWSQVLHDPNDVLYADLDRWAGRGYISMLPPVRPYPAQLVDELLTRVAETGDDEARATAAAYLDATRKGARKFHFGATGLIRGIDDDISLEGAPTMDALFRFQDWMAGSLSLAIYGVTREPGEEIAVPGIYSPYADLIEDQTKVGPFHVLQDWTSILSLGSSAIYFQAGLTRTSVGPFFDNGVIVGPQAGRAGHFDLVYRQPTWSMSVLLLELTATDNWGEGQYPDKHLIFHSFDFQVTDRLELGFFESVVWGDRFEFLYLAPFGEYFAAQSLTGFEDNSYFGVHGKWRPAENLAVLGQVYVDDLNFQDIMKLQLDTKYKFAGELGLRWTPESSRILDAAADYTAVMPYMYTHISGDRTDRYRTGDDAVVNYFNYTHLGRGLGTDLEPNSDRLSVRATLRLLEPLSLKLRAGVQRHGNASEDVDGIDPAKHDGSVFDDGYTDPADPNTSPRNTFNSETRFLTQSVIETLVHGGFGLAWALPTAFGNIELTFDYVAEYGWNRGLVKGEDGLAHYYAIGGTWRW